MPQISTKVQPSENQRSQFMKPRKKSAISGPLTFVIIIFAAIFVMSLFFRVKDIRVEGNVHYTDEDIVKALEIEQGDNLFFFDRFAAVTRVFAKLPYVEEVNVVRNLPDRVTIKVKENEAIAYIPIGAENWTIDEKCKLLGKATEEELEVLIPVVGLKPGTMFINETLTVNEENDRVVGYLRNVLEQIQNRGMQSQITKIDFSDVNHAEIYYGNKYIIRIGDPSQTERKFSMVVSAMSQLLEGDIGIIDVSMGNEVTFQPY